MPVFNLFSTRNTTAPDVFTFNDLPNKLRVQIVHIIKDTFGTAKYNGYGDFYTDVESAYQVIHDALCREYGLFNLNNESSYQSKVLNYLLQEKTLTIA
jgi:hypothetical protein